MLEHAHAPDSLTDRIRELIERIEIDPRTSVALVDIAPEGEWLTQLISGNGAILGDAFVTGVLEILQDRYPLTLPYPFDRLPAVAEHEGWWDRKDGVPRNIAIEIFETAELTGTGSSAPYFAPLNPTQQEALLRALLEVSLAAIVAAKGHPAYEQRA